MDKEKKLLDKKINKAVALSYKQGDIAPKIIAKGRGAAADNIVEKALEEGITIYKDEKLIQNLIGLEINQEIPEDLYEAVAEIIFYIYNLDVQRGNSHGK